MTDETDIAVLAERLNAIVNRLDGIEGRHATRLDGVDRKLWAVVATVFVGVIGGLMRMLEGGIK